MPARVAISRPGVKNAEVRRVREGSAVGTKAVNSCRLIEALLRGGGQTSGEISSPPFRNCDACAQVATNSNLRKSICFEPSEPGTSRAPRLYARSRWADGWPRRERLFPVVHRAQ